MSTGNRDLGMVNPTATEIDITLNGRDFTIKQSPGVLQSDREGGTTGAALWRACLLFAEWLGVPQNPIFRSDVLNSESTVLELGSGISGLVPLTVSPRVRRVIATDQQYALKLLQENADANQPSNKAKKPQSNNIDILPLDWESSDTSSFLRTHGLTNRVDMILVCDCIFNYALIQPLVQTCADICQARLGSQLAVDSTANSNPTICVIAQQLRQPDVFEEWLQAFHNMFRVWRIPDEMLTDGLKQGKGYVVHIGILREGST